MRYWSYQRSKTIVVVLGVLVMIELAGVGLFAWHRANLANMIAAQPAAISLPVSLKPRDGEKPGVAGSAPGNAPGNPLNRIPDPDQDRHDEAKPWPRGYDWITAVQPQPQTKPTADASPPVATAAAESQQPRSLAAPPEAIPPAISAKSDKAKAVAATSKSAKAAAGKLTGARQNAIGSDQKRVEAAPVNLASTDNASADGTAAPVVAPLPTIMRPTPAAAKPTDPLPAAPLPNVSRTAMADPAAPPMAPLPASEATPNATLDGAPGSAPLPTVVTPTARPVQTPPIWANSDRAPGLAPVPAGPIMLHFNPPPSSPPPATPQPSPLPLL